MHKVNWIIETKDRVVDDKTAKENATEDWCGRANAAIGETRRHVRINQTEFVARVRVLQGVGNPLTGRRGGENEL